MINYFMIKEKSNTRRGFQQQHRQQQSARSLNRGGGGEDNWNFTLHPWENSQPIKSGGFRREFKISQSKSWRENFSQSNLNFQWRKFLFTFQKSSIVVREYF